MKDEFKEKIKSYTKGFGENPQKQKRVRNEPLFDLYIQSPCLLSFRGYFLTFLEFFRKLQKLKILGRKIDLMNVHLEIKMTE